MPKPLITVVIPTIPERKASLARCVTAYQVRSGGAHLDIRVVTGAPTCGHAWLQATVDAEGDYIHLTADDLEPQDNWWPDAVEACNTGDLPCPVVRNPDGTVQSAGGDLDEPAHLRTYVAADWTPVPFTTVPFLSRSQWDRIGMIPVHYYSDVWVSERGRQLGIETVLRPNYAFTHHNEPAGRGAGMSQYDRNRHDAIQFDAHLAAATP